MASDKSRLKRRRKQERGKTIPEEPNDVPQSKSLSRYDIVENWLEQTSKHRHQAEVRGSSRISDLFRPISPHNKHLSGVDPKWSSRHILPSDNFRQSGPPFRVLGLVDSRNSTRRRPAPSDSSFISGFETSTKPPGYDHISIRQDCGSTPPAKPPRELDLNPIHASSPTFQVDEPVKFEKKLRHKTKEDKYETKKKKRTRERDGATGQDDPQRKKKAKTEKRKSAISSKNVVDNFSSGAVLNNRITVQPHLKPGLFDNGRASKKQPISDLAFSEMQFLKKQRRSSQPKTLSKSRLRERQREGREIEQISSFFLPHRTDGNTHRLKHNGSGERGDGHGPGHQSRQLSATYCQEPSRSPSSTHYLRSERNHALRSPREGILGPNNVSVYESNNCDKNPGAKTTYFTWSSSRHSPENNKKVDRLSLNESGSEWPTTPESIRRDIIATGIYRSTGISPYDEDSIPDRRLGRAAQRNAHWIDPTGPGDYDKSIQAETSETKKVKYRDQAMMTDSPSRHLKVLPDEQVMGDGQSSGSHGGTVRQTPCNSPVDRQQIVNDTRLRPKDNGSLRQDTIKSPSVRAVELTTAHSSSPFSERRKNQPRGVQSEKAIDQASINSREAMPPPPIPYNGRDTLSSKDGIQASHSINCNDGSLNTPERAESHSTPTSSELNSTFGRKLPSLDAVSWIPQRTPSSTMTKSRHASSRPIVNSPIYIDQLKGDPVLGTSQKKPISQSQGFENIEDMAEFIARIETESKLQEITRDYDNAGLEPALDEAAPDYFQSNPRLSISSEEVEANPGLTSITGDSRTHSLPEEEISEAHYPQYDIGGLNTPQEGLRQVDDFDEERAQMSAFWRPNQFFQY